MADIPLKSFTFPGLPDKYTTPVVDNTLAVAGAAADAKKTGDEIGAIKNDLSEFPNGNYPQMGAGYANQLVSGLKKADQTPYNFRKVPYDATLGEVEKIVGGTIVNNQLFPFENDSWAVADIAFSITNGKVIATGTANSTAIKAIFPSRIYSTLKLIKGHAYFLYFSGDYNFEELRYVIYGTVNQSINLLDKTSKVFKSTVDNCTDSEYVASITSGTTYSATFDTFLVDLTKDFGAAIADYAYSLETATAGAGVAWLKTHFPKQFNAGYQPYDAGTLKSIEGLSEKKTVGFNQWDEVAEVGGIDAITGENVSWTAGIRSKNYIPVFPDVTYYNHVGSGTSDNFQTRFYDADKNYIGYVQKNGNQVIKNNTFVIPSNAHYMRFQMQITYGATYKNDICINLSDPAKNGTYEPYEAHSYALDSDVVLRGIPKVNEQGKLYYDGDEYLPDGTVNRRYGVVDLGTLNFFAYQDMYLCKDLEGILHGNSEPNGGFSNAIAEKYICQGQYDTITETALNLFNNGWITTKTASPSGYLVYTLTTPTTETADPYTTPQIISPDGTEEYIYTDGAFELPVGHSSDYPVDVSGQLDDILDTPSANGTYTLKATVTDGAVTYSWVADA